jgi:hypothetical protein
MGIRVNLRPHWPSDKGLKSLKGANVIAWGKQSAAPGKSRIRESPEGTRPAARLDHPSKLPCPVPTGLFHLGRLPKAALRWPWAISFGPFRASIPFLTRHAPLSLTRMPSGASYKP